MSSTRPTRTTRIAAAFLRSDLAADDTFWKSFYPVVSRKSGPTFKHISVGAAGGGAVLRRLEWAVGAAGDDWWQAPPWDPPKERPSVRDAERRRRRHRRGFQQQLLG